MESYAIILAYVYLCAVFRVNGEVLFNNKNQLFCTNHCLPQVGREQSRKMVFRAASFECFGKVQGVFFRKYTQKEATSLGVVGWIRNTSRDTVEGLFQALPFFLYATVRYVLNVTCTIMNKSFRCHMPKLGVKR